MSDTEFLMCRTFNHRWDVLSKAVGSDIVEPPRKGGARMSVAGVTEIILECSRCKTRRFDYARSTTGVLVRRKYKYVDGYLLKVDQEKPTRVDYRLRVLQSNLRALVGKGK